MTTEELVLMEKEIQGLKDKKASLEKEVEGLFKEKIKTIEEIGEYRKRAKEFLEKLGDSKKDYTLAMGELILVKEELANKLYSIKKAEDDFKESKDKIDLDLAKIDSEKNELVRQWSVHKDTAIKNMRRGVELDKDNSKLLVDKKQVETDKKDADEALAHGNKLHDEALRQLELLRKKEKDLDLQKVAIKGLEDIIKGKESILDGKIVVLNQEISRMGEVKRSLDDEKEKLQLAQQLAVKEKQFYLDRVKELDVKEDQVKLMELRVQKLIKDKDLRDEIAKLEKDVSSNEIAKLEKDVSSK